MKLCSWAFLPTGSSTLTGISSFPSTSFVPIPESSRIWGVLRPLYELYKIGHQQHIPRIYDGSLTRDRCGRNPPGTNHNLFPNLHSVYLPLILKLDHRRQYLLRILAWFRDNSMDERIRENGKVFAVFRGEVKALAGTARRLDFFFSLHANSEDHSKGEGQRRTYVGSV